MDIVLYSAVVSAVVQAVKMTIHKVKPDALPNEVYVVLALALGVCAAILSHASIETGFVVGFTAMGMYSGIKSAISFSVKG